MEPTGSFKKAATQSTIRSCLAKLLELLEPNQKLLTIKELAEQYLIKPKARKDPNEPEHP